MHTTLQAPISRMAPRRSAESADSSRPIGIPTVAASRGVASEIVRSQRLFETRQGQLLEHHEAADVVGSAGPPPIRGVGIGLERETPQGVPEGPEGDDVPVRCDLDPQPPVAGVHGAHRRLHEEVDVPVWGYAEDRAHLDGRALRGAPAGRQGEAPAAQLEVLQRHVEGRLAGAPRTVPGRWASPDPVVGAGNLAAVAAGALDELGHELRRRWPPRPRHGEDRRRSPREGLRSPPTLSLVCEDSHVDHRTLVVDEVGAANGRSSRSGTRQTSTPSSCTSHNLGSLAMAPWERWNEPRLLPLVGAYNFRDLGGYPVAGGRVTRWDRLYRSDTLHELTLGDIETLDDIGLRTVIDLRTPEEVSRNGRGRLAGSDGDT